LFRNFDPGQSRRSERVSSLNRVETSTLPTLPVGNDADHLGRDLSWQTQTINSGKVLMEPKIAQSANFQMSLPSIISTVQVNPVRRMRHSLVAGQNCYDRSHESVLLIRSFVWRTQFGRQVDARTPESIRHIVDKGVSQSSSMVAKEPTWVRDGFSMSRRCSVTTFQNVPCCAGYRKLRGIQTQGNAW
jgi:hypothetical protein